jgi:hypothetical protein
MTTIPPPGHTHATVRPQSPRSRPTKGPSPSYPTPVATADHAGGRPRRCEVTAVLTRRSRPRRVRTMPIVKARPIEGAT